MFREVCLLFLILTACTANGPSSNSTNISNKFSSILFGNGTACCILDAPTVVLVSRSAIGCGVKCLSKPSCSFYNYISASKGCQLFCFTAGKFGLANTCRSYRLQGVQVTAAAQNFLTLNADDVIRLLYLDGIQVTYLPNASKWDVADTVALPSTTRVIAVYVENTDGLAAGYGGLIVSDSSGQILSNSTWKYSISLSSGWMNVDFDDSSWQFPAILFNNSGSVIWPPIPGINSKAWWIWNYAKSTDPLIYFRLRLS